jgi:hypothetical protein
MAGMASVDSSASWVQPAIIGGLSGLLGFIIFGLYACRFIAATKIDDRYM